MSIAGAFSSFGASVGDLFASQGDAAQAQSFGQAAAIAEQNASFYAESGAIQQQQLGQQVFRSQSATQADTAGNGLRLSGSSQDVLRAGAQQGALAQATVSLQTRLNIDASQEQADAYTGEENAAKAAGAAAGFGGIGSALAGVASLGPTLF
jgi:hypothetical protein